MIVLPRLDRYAATELIAEHRCRALAEISGAMPDLSRVVTYSPVGGRRIDQSDLAELRGAVVEIATDYGMPGRISDISGFEGRTARILHEMLPMSANESSYEEVWSYLTCCWLMDVAVWRFGEGADDRRFIGNINRNTFRRLWWRAEMLGTDIDLTQLGEDELVNIMERPSIARDRRLARTVAIEFLARVHDGAADSRMQLMRDAMKRLLRLTPVVAFPGLSDEDLRTIVEQCFTAAAEGVSGGEPERAGRHRLPAQIETGEDRWDIPHVSPGVTAIDRITIPETAGSVGSAPAASPEFDSVAKTALAIARNAGRVTNTSLRELVPITAGEAREVLKALVQDGLLASRGVRRGTYYVLSDSSAYVDKAWPPKADFSTGVTAADHHTAVR
ncbi:MAG: hypothetical protein U0R18_19690 [Mycobacterium sp.]